MLGTYVYSSRVIGGTARAVDRVRACGAGGGYRVATAVRNASSGKLEVITWNAAAADPAHALLARGVSDYPVGEIAIAEVPGGTEEEAYVLTAAERADGHGLHVTLWKIGPGYVSEISDVRADPGVDVANVDVAALDATRFVTASIGRDGPGTLHLHGWDIQGSFGFGPVRQFAHHHGHEAAMPAVAVAGTHPVVARIANGRCELVSYEASGSTFTILDHLAELGTSNDVAITSAPPAGGVVTATRDDDGRVSVRPWRVDPAGKLSSSDHVKVQHGRHLSILDLGADTEGPVTLAKDHVVAVFVGGENRVHALAVDIGAVPEVVIDQPIVTTLASGAASARLPGKKSSADPSSWVDELAVAFIDLADGNRLKLLYLSAHR